MKFIQKIKVLLYTSNKDLQQFSNDSSIDDTKICRPHSLQVHEYRKYMTYTIWRHLTDGAEGEEEEDTGR